jgi:hypothetical protein
MMTACGGEEDYEADTPFFGSRGQIFAMIIVMEFVCSSRTLSVIVS